MSNFVTRIAVDVEAVRKLLPKGSFVAAVEFNGQEVEVRWAHDHLVSPYTFAVEYPLEELKQRRLPEQVRMRQPRPEGCEGAKGVKGVNAPAVMTGGKGKVEKMARSRKPRPD